MENKTKCITNPDNAHFVISEDYIDRLDAKLYQAWKFNSKDWTWDKIASSVSVTDVLDTISKKATTCPETPTEKYIVEWRR